MTLLNLLLSKGLLLITLLNITAGNSYCQEQENSKVYEIRNSIAVYPCYITGKSIYKDNKFSTPPMGAKFQLVRPLNTGSDNDTFIISYLKWNKPKDSLLRKYYNDPLIISKWNAGDSQLQNTPWNIADTKNQTGAPARDNWNNTAGSQNDSGKISSTGENYGDEIKRYFLIQKYDLDSNCVKAYNKGIRSAKFTVGLVTMPLKLRLGTNFDFQGNLSLGSTAGVKIRLSRYNSNYINFLIGTSISTITLDSFSTKGKLSGQPLTNIAVFSPSFGAVFEFGKAQAGIFYGWDFLNKSTQLKYDWIYNKRPWLSIGFGFSILNIDSKSNNSQSQNQ